MKVGFLGNTNNYPFIIASQMKALGCEVVMYVDAPASEILNRPEQYTHDVSYPYPNWIIEKQSLRKSHHTHLPQFFEKSVISELNTCDAVILNDYGHRFKNFINPQIPSISLFSGSDLEIMAVTENVVSLKLNNARLKWVPRFLKKMYARLSVNQLRSAIAKASLISYFPAGLVPFGDRLLHEIFGGRQFNRFSHLHVVTEGYQYYPPAHNNVLRIFSFTRYMWKTPFPPGLNSWENKGNDIMIHGIALFLKQYAKPVDIHLIEKGIHVAETKQLIDELGFAHMVTWHKEMPFKELQDHIIKADVIIEQLGTHFISGGFYAMLMGRPVIGNANPQVLDKLTGQPTPVCQAVTADEVCAWLQKLSTDKNLAERIGQSARQYVLNHFDIRRESEYFKNYLEKITKAKHA